MSEVPKKSKSAKNDKKPALETMEIEQDEKKPPLAPTNPKEKKTKSDDKADFILVCSIGDTVDWTRFGSEETMLKSLVTTICFSEKRIFPKLGGTSSDVEVYKRFLSERKKSTDTQPKDLHYAFTSLKNITKVS